MRPGFIVWAIGVSALVAGCQQRQPQPGTAPEPRTYDTQASPPPAVPSPVAVTRDQTSEDSAGGPNIAVSAAPGVAFNYRYAYRLANARIQGVQEAHAAMCEKLGSARCRITGMRYSLVNESDISASLELKLDPTIARQFGKSATTVVVNSNGMLVDQQISGLDAGSAIKAANLGRAELQDALDRTNHELNRNGVSNVIRDRLLTEAQDLRGQIRALGEQRTASEESLATTPMTFAYGSGTVVPGFDDPHPLRDALRNASVNFLSALGVLIEILATTLPLALAAALLWWLAGRLGIRRRVREPVSRLDSPLDELPSSTA